MDPASVNESAVSSDAASSQTPADTLAKAAVVVSLFAGIANLVQAGFTLTYTIRVWSSYPATDRYDDVAACFAALMLMIGAVTAAIGLRGRVGPLRVGLSLVAIGGLGVYGTRIFDQFVNVGMAPDLLDQADQVVRGLGMHLECLVAAGLALVTLVRLARPRSKRL